MNTVEHDSFLSLGAKSGGGLAVLVILVALLGSGCGEGAGAASIQLGGIFNLTGAQASLDVPSRNGAALAVEQINAAGGVLGRRVELVTADGETDTAVLQARTGELLAGGAVAVFGLSDTDAVLAAAPASTRDLSGVTGIISYADGSHIPHKTVTVVRLQGGQRTLAAQLIPAYAPPA
jgi:hypothetical protein